MKTLHLYLIASFLISLLVGFIAGNLIFQKIHSAQQTNSIIQQVSTTPGKQEGIWLIAVDRLNDPTPQIEGVWLMAYITNYGKIKPLPLYPSDNPQHDTELVNTFQFTSDNQIAPAFLDFLQNHGQNVNDYIVFDEIAAVEIIDFYGGVTIQGKHLNGFEALNLTPETRDDPQASLEGQIAIMDNLCSSIFNNHTAPDLYKLQRKVGRHLLSNLNLGEKSKELQKQILSGNHIICDFPDLFEKQQISSKP